MKHMVRPVWIALEGTAVPDDIKERCRRSFEHIQQYFLKKVGKTFQVEELVVIRTRHTAECFQEYRSEYVPLLGGLRRIIKNKSGRGYSPELSNLDIFCLNLIAFIRKKLDADNNQIWIIFISATEKGAFERTSATVQTGSGGYVVISEYLPPIKFFSREFISDNLVIAHELCHVFGLINDRERTDGLMFWFRSPETKLSNCSLNQKEKWILSRSPFFTEEKL